jgi:hypothetical protein
MAIPLPALPDTSSATRAWYTSPEENKRLVVPLNSVTKSQPCYPIHDTYKSQKLIMGSVPSTSLATPLMKLSCSSRQSSRAMIGKRSGFTIRNSPPSKMFRRKSYLPGKCTKIGALSQRFADVSRVSRREFTIMVKSWMFLFSSTLNTCL